jgi:hypothetical protein
LCNVTPSENKILINSHSIHYHSIIYARNEEVGNYFSGPETFMVGNTTLEEYQIP